MNYLSVEGLSKIYADKVLFKDITFHINEGHKVALIARNGAGKSSMMRILSGKDVPDAGTYQIKSDVRMGFLEQEPVLNDNYSVLDEVFYSENPIHQAIREYEASLLQPDDARRMSAAVEKMDSTGAWDYEVKVKLILSKLKIHQLTQKVGTLSGGEKKRVALAKILIQEPDFMILDEPTNHLDLDMIEWLEDFLIKEKMTLFMVTHDRYFLERVCDQILELENGAMVRYKGNYSDYLQKKSERHENLVAETDKAKSLMRKELEWMRRQPKARTTKAKSRIDAFDHIKEKASVQVKQEEMELKIKTERLGSKIVELHNIGKSFGERLLFEKLNYKFKRSEKVGVLGRNGSGKSTFLNILTGSLEPDTGKVVIGDTVKLGYYTQDGMQLKEGQRVIEVIREIADNISVEGGGTISAVQFLERFLFPRTMHFNYVEQLSGGEKRRLYLMTVLIKNPNFLILDEPTNDLDILTLNVLEEFLQNYQGCLLIVSHDRYFMDKLVEHCFVFGEGTEVRDFPGNYTQLREAMAAEEKQVNQAKSIEKQTTEAAAAAINKPKKLSYNEQREFFNLEKDIEKLEKRKKEIEASLSNPNASGEDLTKLSEEFAEVDRQINEKTDRWIELSEKMENA